MRKIDKELLPPILGVCAFLLLGIGLLVWPAQVTQLFPPLIGLVMMVAGGLQLLWSLFGKGEKPGRDFQRLQGIVTLLVGFVFIVKADLSLAFLSILFGLYVLVSASVDFSEALRSRRLAKPWAGQLAGSLLRFVLGLLLLFSPFGRYNLWARLLGGYFVATAAGLLHWLLTLRAVDDREEKDNAGKGGGENGPGPDDTDDQPQP